jgi:hypothetical protein
MFMINGREANRRAAIPCPIYASIGFAPFWPGRGCVLKAATALKCQFEPISVGAATLKQPPGEEFARALGVRPMAAWEEA